MAAGRTPDKSFSWMIGGPQGSGINTSAEILAKAFCRQGYYVFGNIEYHSNIKGKHSYYRLRISDQPVHSHIEAVHLLVALEEETLFGDLYHEFPAHEGHIHEVADGGGILFEEGTQGIEDRLNGRRVHLLPIPYTKIVDEALTAAGKPGQAHEYRIMNNTAALGASAGLLGIDFGAVTDVVMEGFKGKARKVGEMNVNCARLAYDYVQKHFGGTLEFKLPPPPVKPVRQVMIKGTQAVALAKLKAGCGVQTYYPISPATDESVYLENFQSRYSLVVLQTEDEVSAVDAAVMAAHGGARAATSTSGPGLALMPEGLGFAAVTEAPGPIIVDYMRGGPSTGLPTRHEQGDLRFALHAGQSDIPRILMAPGDLNECFYDTFDAFNYGDRYQVPVIILTDRHLAAQYTSVPPFDTTGLKIDRGALYAPTRPAGGPDTNGNGEFWRYRFNEEGISPRSIPGQEGGAFWTTSDEHDQVGHITESIANRLAKHRKRMEKLTRAAREIPEQKKFNLFGKKKAPISLVSWGSTKGAILEALRRVDPELESYNFIQVRIIQPFPTESLQEILAGAGKVVVLECNYSGQLAGILREKTGIKADHKVLKYDGRPFSEDEVVAGLEAATGGKAGEEIVISQGGVADPASGPAEVERLVELRKRAGKKLPPMVPLPPGYNR